MSCREATAAATQAAADLFVNGFYFKGQVCSIHQASGSIVESSGLNTGDLRHPVANLGVIPLFPLPVDSVSWPFRLPNMRSRSTIAI